MKKLILTALLTTMMLGSAKANLDTELPRYYVGAMLGYGSTTGKFSYQDNVSSGSTPIGYHDANVSLIGGSGLFVNGLYVGGEIGFTGANDTITSTYGNDKASGKNEFQLKRNSYLTGSALGGYLINSSTMAYVRLGLNFSKWTLNDSISGNFDVNNTARGSSNLLSFVPGLGLETEVENLIMRLEYVCEFGRSVLAQEKYNNINSFSKVTNIRNQSTKVGLIFKF